VAADRTAGGSIAGLLPCFPCFHPAAHMDWAAVAVGRTVVAGKIVVAVKNHNSFQILAVLGFLPCFHPVVHMGWTAVAVGRTVVVKNHNSLQVLMLGLLPSYFHPVVHTGWTAAVVTVEGSIADLLPCLPSCLPSYFHLAAHMGWAVAGHPAVHRKSLRFLLPCYRPAVHMHWIAVVVAVVAAVADTWKTQTCPVVVGQTSLTSLSLPGILACRLPPVVPGILAA